MDGLLLAQGHGLPPPAEETLGLAGTAPAQGLGHLGLEQAPLMPGQALGRRAQQVVVDGGIDVHDATRRAGDHRLNPAGLLPQIVGRATSTGSPSLGTLSQAGSQGAPQGGPQVTHRSPLPFSRNRSSTRPSPPASCPCSACLTRSAATGSATAL